MRIGERRRQRSTAAAVDGVQAAFWAADDLHRAAHRVSGKARQLNREVCTRPFPSEFGEFTLHVFRNKLDNRHHLALAMGRLGPEPTLVRVHSENLLGDVFRMRGVDSHHALVGSLEAVARAGRGVVLYMEHANGGAELIKRLDAKPGEAPTPMGFRDYGIGAQILAALGLRKISLLSQKYPPRSRSGWLRSGDRGTSGAVGRRIRDAVGSSSRDPALTVRRTGSERWVNLDCGLCVWARP